MIQCSKSSYYKEWGPNGLVGNWNDLGSLRDVWKIFIIAKSMLNGIT